MAIPPQVLADAYVYSSRVDSWLGGQWQGQVPVADGSVAWTTSQQVPGSLSLTVPRVGSAQETGEPVDWTPSSPASALGCFGQVLHVELTVASTVTGQTWSLPAGRFLITSTEIGPTSVSVTAKSLLERVEEDRLTSPMAPRRGSTLGAEARRLLAGHMGLVIDPALRDRACPTSMTWGESRIDALYDLADAWPARLREGRDGLLYFLPPLDDLTQAPSRVLTDGQDGTIVGVKRTAARAKVYNRIVVRGQQTDDSGQPTIQVVVDQTHGPLRVGGPYGVVPKFFSSPLINSDRVARSTATTMLASSIRAAQTIPIEHAPDPSLELDDAVTIRTHDAEGTSTVEAWGRVTAMDLPLTASGTARTDVEVIAW